MPKRKAEVLFYTVKKPRDPTGMCLPEQMFQKAYLHVMENNCVKLLRNPSTIVEGVEVMVQTNLDGRADTHIRQTVNVTSMSRSLQAGSTKMTVFIYIGVYPILTD